MCDALVASVSMASTSGLIQAASSLYTGKLNKDLYRKQAENTEIAARQLEEQGRSATRAARTKTAQMVGAQRAAMGGSGVDVNTGSSLDVQVETGKLGTMDELAIKQDFANKAWGMRADAAIMRTQGKAAEMLGNLGAASALLSASGSVADKFYRYNTLTAGPYQYSYTPSGGPWSRRQVPREFMR